MGYKHRHLLYDVKGAWAGPARWHWVPHGKATAADFPVRSIVGGLHFIADLTLPTAVCFMTALCAKKINYD